MIYAVLVVNMQMHLMRKIVTDILKEIKKKDPEFESKINLVVPGADVTEDLKYPGHMIVDMPMSLQHYKWIVDNNLVLDEEALDYVGIVFQNGEITEDNWKDQGSGVQHLIGRIDLTLKIWKSKTPVPLVWRYPEAGLSPGVVANVADVIIKLWTNYVFTQHWWKSKDF